ncbi:MAG: peptide/nickel transport system ATP-binding protein [Solirubrobacteraceae bacterium]
MTLLTAKDLRVCIGGVEIVRLEELTIERGRHLAIVGESGSGKTMTAMSLIGLQPKDAVVSGSVRLGEQEILQARERDLRLVRGLQVGVVFQDPLRSLNPTMRVGRQVEEALRLHEDLTGRERKARVLALLERVRLPDPGEIARRYPHELSGGQRQRILIAGAIACQPQLLIADEPTTALDVTVQNEILELLRELSRDEEMSVLLISHNLGVVRSLCQEVAVMYGGHLVERGSIADVIARPRHRYTKALIDANPRFDPSEPGMFDEPLRGIPGTVPAAGRLPAGCPFRGRCEAEVEQCSAMPQFTAAGPHHAFRCWNPVPGELRSGNRAKVAQ